MHFLLNKSGLIIRLNCLADSSKQISYSEDLTNCSIEKMKRELDQLRLEREWKQRFIHELKNQLKIEQLKIGTFVNFICI